MNSIAARLAALALIWPTLALAQTPAPATAPAQAPAPAPTTTTLAQPRNIAPATARFARCLAERRPAEADAYLATAPGTPQEAQALNAMVPVGDSACTSSAPAAGEGLAAIPIMFLRGSLAESRYRARYSEAAPPAIASAQPSGMADEVFRARIAAAADPALELTRVFADCVVAAWAPGVDHLIRTEAGSASERTALTALELTIGSCLYSDQTVQFTRETLRAPLADALYRKSEGTTATVQSPAPAQQEGEER